MPVLAVKPVEVAALFESQQTNLKSPYRCHDRVLLVTADHCAATTHSTHAMYNTWHVTQVCVMLYIVMDGRFHRRLLVRTARCACCLSIRDRKAHDDVTKSWFQGLSSMSF